MALTTDTFTRISSGPVQVFVYKTTDAIGTCDDADYFFTAGTGVADGRNIRHMINEHDVIWVVDITNDLVDALIVTASTSATITTAIASRT